MEMQDGIDDSFEKTCLLNHKPPHEHVLEVLIALCQAKSFDKQEMWPSTRDVAEQCCLGIYQTRYLLLKIVANGQAISTSHRIKNTLRWYPLIKQRQEK
ncbi:hypothetical protein SM14VA2_48290 (plasmid) [Serratia marcescens]|nr:hypothetical protein SM14VA2_48290 [Serratia marcescens]